MDNWTGQTKRLVRQGCPVRFLPPLPQLGSDSHSFQQTQMLPFLYEISKNCELKGQASILYIQSVIRTIIRSIERQGEEMIPEIAELYSSLLLHIQSMEMNTRNSHASKTLSNLPFSMLKEYSWITSDSGKSCSMQLLEDTHLVAHGSTGLRTWTGALALGEYLIAHPNLLRGRCSPPYVASGANILELGSGTGALGILCSILGASHVTLTDYEDHILDLIRYNCTLNEACMSAHDVKRLDWLDFAQFGNEQFGNDDRNAYAWTHAIDLVVGSDLIYDPEIISPLVETLSILLCSTKQNVGHPPPIALVATTFRRQETWDDFVQQCSAKDIQIEILPQDMKRAEDSVFFMEEGRDNVRITRLYHE